MGSLKSILKPRVIFAVLASVGVFWYLCELLAMRHYANPMELSGTFAFLLFFAFYYFYEKVDLSTRRIKLFTLVSAGILSLTYVIGAQLDITHSIHWHINTILKIIMLSWAFVPATNYILTASFTGKSKRQFSLKKTIILIALIQFIFFLISFPGVYGYDAGYQLLQFSDPNISITQTYSIVHSAWLYLTIVKIGVGVFGSAEIGLAIYAFLQSALAILIIYIALKIASKYLPVAIIKMMALCAVLPFSLIMYISTSQDTIFGLFAFLIVLILTLASIHQEILRQKETQMILGASVLMMCLLRNNGVYILAFLLLFVLIFKYLRDKNKKIVLPIACAIMIYVFFQIFLAVYGIIDFEAERNKMSIPSQQLTRCVVSNADQLSEDLINRYHYYYPRINLNIYKLNQQIADYQKNHFDSVNFNKNKLAFFKYYAKMFLKCPKSYAEAFLFNTIGYWYLDKNYPDPQMYHPVIEYEYRNLKQLGANDKYYDIKRQSILPDVERDISQNIQKALWKNTPFINIFFRISIPFTLFWIAWIKILYRKKYYFFLPMIFLTGYYGTYFLAMVALFRYQFAVWLSVPLLLFIIFYDREKKKGFSR